MTSGIVHERSGGPYDQRLARWLVRPLAAAGVHPNAVTGVSFLFGMAAALLFAFHVEAMAGWAALLFMLAVLTDHGDGELARMTDRTSHLGHRLDYLVGTTNYAMLFIGIGIGLGGAGWGGPAVAFGLAVGLANPIICALRMVMDDRYGGEAVSHPRFGGFELEDFIYLIGPITWLGGLEYFFLLYGGGTLGYLIFTVVAFLRRRHSHG